MATTKFSKVQWGDGLTVTPDPDDESVIRVDSSGGGGADGADGADGVGVPAGGSDGQVLTKVSSTDFDTDWETPSGGGGAPTGAAGGVLDGSYPNPGLAASVAGAGLTEASDVLSVNVDGATLVVASDQVKVNTDGNSGHYLNGAGGWTAPSATVAHLDDVGDVAAPSPSDEDVLYWDAGGGNWSSRQAVLPTIADAKGDLVAASGADAVARLPVGTNGQVLSADSTQTLGVTWTTLPGGGMVADTLWDAKGDLAAGTGADTAAKLTVGSNGQVLTADSTQTTGLKWAAAGGGGGAWTLLSTTTLASDAPIDVSGISGSYNDLLLQLMFRLSRAAPTDTLLMRLNNDSGTNYSRHSIQANSNAVVGGENLAATSLNLLGVPAATAGTGIFAPITILIPGYTSTTWKKQMLVTMSGTSDISTGNVRLFLFSAIWNSTAAITRIGFFGSTSTNLLTGSQMRIYGIT